MGLLATVKRCAIQKQIGVYSAAKKNEVVEEMPCEDCGGCGWYGVLRLRMTSTAWASCFVQDDK
jgi:hypothetical protein